VVVLFGAGRIANIGSELGTAIRNFRQGMQDGEQDDDDTPDSAEKAKR